MSSEHLDVDESSVTMMDVLEQQEALAEDADAVLGGDDENCTYPQVSSLHLHLATYPYVRL